MGTDETRQPPLPVSDIPEQQLTDEDRRLLDSAKELFIGSYSHSLDGKGRLVVPQPFRERLGASFCIAPGQDFHSIALYSTVAWVRLRERYAKLARFNQPLTRFLTQFDALSYRDQVCDGQGRILLPARIRQMMLGNEKDVEITGAYDHVRVVTVAVSAEQFKDFMRDLPGILDEISLLDREYNAEAVHDKE